MGFFQYWACFLNLPYFLYSRFLALQGRFLNFSRFSPWFLKFYKKRKTAFFTKKNLFYCTFWYMLVLFGFMALDHCTVINSVRPFLFVHKEQLNVICFFPFLNLNTFWVLRFLFLWTFTNSFLRPKKPTTAFLKFSKIWVLFLIYRFLYSDTECIYDLQTCSPWDFTLK